MRYLQCGSYSQCNCSRNDCGFGEAILLLLDLEKVVVVHILVAA